MKLKAMAIVASGSAGAARTIPSPQVYWKSRPEDQPKKAKGRLWKTEGEQRKTDFLSSQKILGENPQVLAVYTRGHPGHACSFCLCKSNTSAIFHLAMGLGTPAFYTRGSPRHALAPYVTGRSRPACALRIVLLEVVPTKMLNVP